MLECSYSIDSEKVIFALRNTHFTRKIEAVLEIWAVFFCCGGAVGGGGRGLNSFCQLELFEKRLYCDPMLNVQAAAAPTQICAALEDAAAQAGEA